MSMVDYENAVSIMKDHPDMCFFAGPRPQALIETAETALGWALTPTYQRFVLEFGAGNFGAAEFYGVIHSNFQNGRVPNGIWLTLKMRSTGLPGHMIVVGTGGVGTLICLDMSQIQRQEAPVIVFAPGLPAESQSKDMIASSFGAFLLDQVKAELNSSE